MGVYWLKDQKINPVDWPWGEGELAFNRALKWLPRPSPRPLPYGIQLAGTFNHFAIKKPSGSIQVVQGTRVPTDVKPIEDWSHRVSTFFSEEFCRTFVDPCVHCYGIDPNGTVILSHGNTTEDTQGSLDCPVGWTNIRKLHPLIRKRAIDGVVGLKWDGSVVVCGSGEEMEHAEPAESWDEIIVDVSHYEDAHVVGLTKDGNLVVSSFEDAHSDYDRYAVNNFTDVVKVQAIYNLFDEETIMGLRSDGTLLKSSEDSYTSDDIPWRNIVDFFIDFQGGIYGLTANGNIMHRNSSFDLDSLPDKKYIAIHNGKSYFVALASDFKLHVAPAVLDEVFDCDRDREWDTDWISDIEAIDVLSSGICKPPIISVPTQFPQTSAGLKKYTDISESGGLGISPASIGNKRYLAAEKAGSLGFSPSTSSRLNHITGKSSATGIDLFNLSIRQNLTVSKIGVGAIGPPIGSSSELSIRQNLVVSETGVEGIDPSGLLAKQLLTPAESGSTGTSPSSLSAKQNLLASKSGVEGFAPSNLSIRQNLATSKVGVEAVGPPLDLSIMQNLVVAETGIEGVSPSSISARRSLITGEVSSEGVSPSSLSAKQNLTTSEVGSKEVGPSSLSARQGLTAIEVGIAGVDPSSLSIRQNLAAGKSGSGSKEPSLGSTASSPKALLGVTAPQPTINP